MIRGPTSPRTVSPVDWGWGRDEAARHLGHCQKCNGGHPSLKSDGSGRPFDETEDGYVPVLVMPQSAVMMADLEGTPESWHTVLCTYDRVGRPGA